MATLLILNQQPYDGTDVTWNTLRLARQLHNDGVEVRIFLMNDSVDLARDGINPPKGVEDMVAMTKELIESGIPVKVCGTCQQEMWRIERPRLLQRCTIFHNGRTFTMDPR